MLYHHSELHETFAIWEMLGLGPIIPYICVQNSAEQSDDFKVVPFKRLFPTPELNTARRHCTAKQKSWFGYALQSVNENGVIFLFVVANGYGI